MELKITNKKGEIFTILYDENDHQLIRKHKWFTHKNKFTSYAETVITIENKIKYVGMHRLLLGINERSIVVDHKNGNGLDNRRCNIRPCTQSQNLMNRACFRGISKFIGVTWDKINNKWYASITKDKKLKNLGRYEYEKDAANAYDKAAITLHGEFAKLNF